MLVLVVAVGTVGGLVGAAYTALLKLCERGLWPSHWSTTAHLGVMVAVGAVVAVVLRTLGSPGDVELLVDNIHVRGGSEDLRDLRSLIPVSLLCIASGGAMGPEAPLVQMTGGLGSWIARRWRVSTVDGRILTITGMAAGFAVLFGAPLGSAVFALEILHRRGLEYYEALIPAVIGALSGYAVNVVVSRAGMTPVWTFPAVHQLHAVDLLLGCAAGVAGASVAVVFTVMTRAARWGSGHLVPALRPVVGGAALGLLAFWSPDALTFGEAQLRVLAVGRVAAGTLVVAAFAKLCGTVVTLAAGWRGGFIIPLLFVGVAVGRLGHVLVPGTDEVVLVAAVMAAAICGVTKTPLGSTLVVAEMCGMRLLPPVLLASVVALVLTSRIGVIDSQRERTVADAGRPPDLPGP